MRGRGGDQVGRWPWGMWLALVGVSAGTVASFAAIGWISLYASGAGGDAEALEWDRDRVVIEAEETPDGASEEPAGSGGSEPSAATLAAPEPEAATLEEAPRADPEPERSDDEPPRLVPVEPEPTPEEASREEQALVPIESRSEHATEERLQFSDGGSNGVALGEQRDER